MTSTIQTALIAASAALFTGALSSYITWRLDRRRWLTTLKAAFQTEVQKTRLVSYAQAWGILKQLSTRAIEPVTSNSAKAIAQELNDWLYSAGGMCAEATTRGAIIVLREVLFNWETGDQPERFYEWRNTVLLLLRRDLDLPGLEDYDQQNMGPLIGVIQADTERVRRSRRR